jgi:hypothetical protein
MKAKHYALGGLILLFFALALAVPASLDGGRITVIPEWTPGEFTEAFMLRNPGWEVRRLPRGSGVVLKHTSDRTPWEEVLDLAERPPERFASEKGRLCIVPFTCPSEDGPETSFDLPPVTVRGHPEEIAKILATFR